MPVSREFAVSTDIVGLLGNPTALLELYPGIKQYPGFKGIEALAFNVPRFRSFEKFEQEAAAVGLPIVGVHGRTGGSSFNGGFVGEVKLLAANMSILPTNELLAKYGSKYEYTLLHQPEADDQVNIYDLVGNRKNLLYVENHPTEGGDIRALKTVKLFKGYGFKVGYMYDLAHHVRSLECNPTAVQFADLKDSLTSVLDSLDHDQDKSVPVGVHLPIGPNLADSLPPEMLTPGYLKELAKVIDGRVPYIVIENQQLAENNLWSSGRKRFDRAMVNFRKMDALISAGIIG